MSHNQKKTNQHLTNPQTSSQDQKHQSKPYVPPKIITCWRQNPKDCQEEEEDDIPQETKKDEQKK